MAQCKTEAPSSPNSLPVISREINENLLDIQPGQAFKANWPELIMLPYR